MDDVRNINWVVYFQQLSDDELRELATWLAVEFVKVSEFTDIVDREYAQTSDEWHGRSGAFVGCRGRPAVEEYARRKRRFPELLAALEDAYMRGALLGEVAPEELQPLCQARVAPRTTEELLGVLERVRSGSP